MTPEPDAPAWLRYLFLAVERIGGPLVLAALILYYLKTRINGSLALFITAIKESTIAHQESAATLREMATELRNHDTWAKQSVSDLKAAQDRAERLADRTTRRR